MTSIGINFIALLLVVLSPFPGEAQTGDQSLPPARKGGLTLRPGTNGNYLRDHFARQLADGTTDAFLVRRATTFYVLEQRELSRLESSLKGADMAATLGLVAGALAGATDTWDEKTSWYIAGAAAALGAIFGGTKKHKDPDWRLQYRWRPVDSQIPESIDSTP